MAKTSQVPFSVRLGNVLSTTLLRAGLPLVGRGNHPMYLLAIIEKNVKRYLCTPFGVGDWVRNLRAAGEAILTRGRRSETVNARELPEARGGPRFARRNQGRHSPGSLLWRHR